ncbi:MAG: aldo/keto reductase [Cyclobacteriaceae bacterium]
MNDIKIKIASNGPEFSRVVAGVWKWGEWGHKLKPQEVLELIESCVDFGVTTFDHADIYGGYTDEGLFGAAIKRNWGIREKVQIVTKCGIKMVNPNRPSHKVKHYDTSAAHIIWSVENSLKQLQTDWIDLLLIHRPDPLMDPDEIAEAFQQLKSEGKVRHFGVSNFTPSQFEMLNSRVALCTNQVQASLIHVDPLFDGTFDQCIQKEVRPMAWSPLGSGDLFGDSDDERISRIQAALKKFEKKYEATADQLLLAWLLNHPAQILPVLGTAKPKRIEAAVNALKIDLEREDWFEMLEVSRGKAVA